MDVRRRQEIAFLLLKQIFHERGFYLHSSFRQEFENTIAAIGVAASDASEFVDVIAREFIEQNFPDPEHSDTPLGRIVDDLAKSIGIPEPEVAEFIGTLVIEFIEEEIRKGS